MFPKLPLGVGLSPNPRKGRRGFTRIESGYPTIWQERLPQIK
jgi:hypothetical protein